MQDIRNCPEIIRFFDYNTLVAAKFVAARFRHVIAKYASELPRQHTFLVAFYTSYVNYIDLTIRARLKSIRYDAGNQASLAVAFREVAEVVGAHAVANLIFSENTWNMTGVGIVFEAAAAQKYADELGLNSQEGSAIGNDSDAFMHSFTRLKTLRIRLDFDMFRQFSWNFLHHECARELRLIKGCVSDAPTLREKETLKRCIENLVPYCVTRRRLLVGGALELDFSQNHFPLHSGCGF